VSLSRLYETMLLVRRVEERVIAQYAEQNAVFARKEVPASSIRCPTHLSIGQEAAAAGVCAALDASDVVFSTHRCHAHYLAKGGSLRAMMAELFGKVDGCARGKGGSMHLVDTSVGMLGASAIVGGSIPLAVGAALSAKMRGTDRVAAAFFGDGAVEQGVFHEALHVAALRALPALFVCENNFYATLSHVATRQRTPIADRAASYGAVGVTVEGDDVLAVLRAADEAVARARGGGGPTLLEIRAYRWMSHVGTEPDTGKMRRTADELAEWQRRCPIIHARTALLDAGATVEELHAIDAKVQAAIEDAVVFARASPEPDVTELTMHLGAGLQP
jgi:TPP-dependent pyruvate/acetoin dehydrogenase alpha subunit